MPLSNADRAARYVRQNRGRPLTARQQRRIRHHESGWPADWGTPEVEPGCCALDATGGGYGSHDGPCARICDHCQGTGKCPACEGTGDDGSGLDYTCMECGGGSCPYCDEGMVTDDHH